MTKTPGPRRGNSWFLHMVSTEQDHDHFICAAMAQCHLVVSGASRSLADAGS